MHCIYFVTGEFPPMRGGMGDYTRELAVALAQRGHEVHVIAHLQARGALRDERVSQHISVHPIVPAWNWQGLYRVLRFLKEERVLLLHIQYQTAAYRMHPAINALPWLVTRMGTTPKIAITYHDLRVPYLFPKAGPLREWITFFPARHAHLVIATNSEDQHRLQQQEITATRIPIGANVHPVTVTADVVRRAREKWRIPANAFVIGYFGFLNRSKGVTDLLGAVGRLVDEGENVHLLMMGEPLGASDPTNRAYMEEVTALVVAQKLQNRVHWTGFLDDEGLSVGFALADLVVLPYRDGASMRRGTLHAALVNGAAILTTRPHVPIPELEKAVWFTSPFDPHALTYAIRHLMRAPGLRRALQARAREVARQFSWEIIAQQHEDVYQRLST